MSTDPQPTDRARVWHLAGVGNPPIPTDHPTVRDDLMRIWHPSPHGHYTTGEGRHHATWNELRARHDLVEVLAEDPGGTP